jgi:sodium leak channel non-selective protein
VKYIKKVITIITVGTFCSGFQWKQEERHTGPLAMVSTGLTLVFVVEVLMKIIAFTPHGYWQSRRNRYDLFVTVMGVLWIILNSWLRVRHSRSIPSFFF